MAYIGGSGPQTGLYGTFTSTTAVVDAAKKGWPGISSVSGTAPSSASPYTSTLMYNGHTVPYYVGQAYHQGVSFWWNDYWTVSGPSSTENDWTSAGKTAGEHAAGGSVKSFV